MALLPIVQYPDPRLAEKAQPVTEFNDELKQLAADMAETMYAAPGVGLAAPQIGKLIRMMVVDISEDKNDLRVFVNPVIEPLSDEVVDCEEGSQLIYGFDKEISREEFADRIKNNTLLEVTNNVPVHKGDVFFIESGTLHAIGKGILIAEIQQNSNTTYRVYDYGRVGKDGKPRELHIEKAIDVTELCPPKYDTKPQGKPVKIDGGEETLLRSCEYFDVHKIKVSGTVTLDADEKSFMSVLVLDGSGKIGELDAKKGDSFFVPAGYGRFTLTGNLEVILSDIV